MTDKQTPSPLLLDIPTRYHNSDRQPTNIKVCLHPAIKTDHCQLNENDASHILHAGQKSGNVDYLHVCSWPEWHHMNLEGHGPSKDESVPCFRAPTILVDEDEHGVNTRKVGNVITSKLVDSKTLKIPRPANAFILYRKDKHAKVVKQNPKLHNTKISVIIGSMWQNESTEVRYDYKTRAERVKVEHSLRFPGYQYQPRKPSEKKRRMTKKKLNGVDIVPTCSHEIISSFASIPQAGETVVGDPSETRVVPLPHLTAVTDTIDAHNAVNSNYGINIRFENPALSFGIGNLTYFDEYEAAQKADLSIFPSYYNPLEEFLNPNF